MPELDLSLVSALRIANQDALEVRIANQTVWTAPQGLQQYSIFGTFNPEDVTDGTYGVYDDLNPGAWLGANFYIRNETDQIEWKLNGIRIWVPFEYTGPLLTQSGYVAYQNIGDEFSQTYVGQPSDITDAQVVINRFASNGSKTAFTGLQHGWNDIYFSQPLELKPGNGFSVGYTIGDGRYYVHGDPGWSEIQSASGESIFISYHGTEEGRPKRGEFGIPDNAATWSAGHYGLDVLVTKRITTPVDEHSIWGITTPEGDYTTDDDLTDGGWTTANFYSYSEESPQNDWTLVGGRIWVPQDDEAGITGMTAECGYYIKPSGAINRDDDEALSIIQNIIASPTVTTTLHSGWNTVYFPAPIALPWAAGIAIGWRIGTGEYHVYSALQPEPILAKDGAPFRLAASSVGTETRGAFSYNNDSTAYWQYNNSYYGIDIIVKKPE